MGKKKGMVLVQCRCVGVNMFGLFGSMNVDDKAGEEFRFEKWVYNDRKRWVTSNINGGWNESTRVRVYL